MVKAGKGYGGYGRYLRFLTSSKNSVCRSLSTSTGVPIFDVELGPLDKAQSDTVLSTKSPSRVAGSYGER